MKYIYGSNYDKLEFFTELKEKDSKIIKEKKADRQYFDQKIFDRCCEVRYRFDQ